MEIEISLHSVLSIGSKMTKTGLFLQNYTFYVSFVLINTLY